MAIFSTVIKSREIFINRFFSFERNNKFTARWTGADGLRGKFSQDFRFMILFSAAIYSCAFAFFKNLLGQVFHVCEMNGRQDSFLCPNGTIFSQKLFACDWWYNVKCDSTESHYRLNRNLFQVYPKFIIYVY